MPKVHAAPVGTPIRNRASGRRKMVSRPGGRRPKPIRDHRRMEEAAWSRADAMAVLDSPERRASQDPDQLWRRLGLKPGETVVDVGAGSGFYAFPAAAVVGPSGRVYAVDVSPELVELVRERAANRKVRNVESVLSTPKRIPIEDAVADVAILANVLHGIPPKTVDETIRLLRARRAPRGRRLEEGAHPGRTRRAPSPHRRRGFGDPFGPRVDPGRFLRARSVPLRPGLRTSPASPASRSSRLRGVSRSAMSPRFDGSFFHEGN